MTKIIGPDRKEVELPPRPPPERVPSGSEAFIITNMLESVVKEGTGRGALELKRPCAGKTGTSNAARDAWFVGFVPSLADAVWVGFDDFKSLGKEEFGSRCALPVWLAFMKEAVRGKPMRRFGMPSDGVVTASIDAWDGQPDAITEVFLEGTEPTESALPPASEVLVEDLPAAPPEVPPDEAEPAPAPPPEGP